MRRALLLVDHGSRRAEANAVVEEIARAVRERSPGWTVEAAHMELAAPDVAEGVRLCAERGAEELVVVPYFLGPGRHASEDIPRLVREAAAGRSGLALRFAEPLGAHPRLVDAVLDRVAEAELAARPGADGPTLDVWFDYGSPYSYFALDRLERLAARFRARLQWKPVDLEALPSFQPPGPASDAKLRYVVADVTRTADFLGIPIEFPHPFPVRSELAVRGALVAQDEGIFPAWHRAVFRAAWVERLDLGHDEVLAECVRDAGGDPEDFLARARGPEIRERLTALAREADAAGVFGVPTVVLEDELFWGSDRLDVLEWRLRQGT